MSRLVVQHDVDDAGLALLTRERDDVVAERADGDGRFVQDHGPLRSYERVLDVTSRDGRHQVTERITYRAGLPYWGPLLALPIRSAVRRHRRHDGRQPAWAPPQRLDHRSARVLATLAAVVVLSGFLSNAPSETLTYSADEFGFDADVQGVTGAVVRLGTIFALGLAVIADRRGRRTVLAIAAFGGIAASVAAAATPNITLLTVALVVTRTCNATIAGIAAVLAVEEMPAGCRAYALSILGMAAALGAGAVVWVQPVADVDPAAWRIVYLVPIIMAPFVVGVVRRLPESKRFRAPTGPVPLRPHWRTAVLLGGTFMLISLFLAPIDWFRNEYLRDEHGFSATRVSLLIIVTATPGGIGLLFAGRLADTVGRRGILRVAIVVGLGLIVLFFNAAGSALWLLALGASVLSAGLLPTLGTFRSELFPTPVRARAASAIAILSVAGGAVGILLVGWLRVEWGSFGPVIALLWVAPLVALVILLVRVPETAGVELEELSGQPTDAAQPPGTGPLTDP